MEIDRFHELLATDGARLVTVARGLASDAPVPTCPGWTVRDLVVHTAQVYRHKLDAIALVGAEPERREAHPPVDRDAVDWLADVHAELVQTLRGTPPAAPSWTWWPVDQTVGFWSRRMAHETAVHRVDVESAAAVVTPVDAELAVDGVDEVLHLMLGGDWSDDPEVGSVGTVVVSTPSRTWRVAMTPERVVVHPGAEAGADVAITAGASDLDLWLWGRLADSVVRVEGDAVVAQRFRARLALATQ